jgi:hypothetical protein
MRVGHAKLPVSQGHGSISIAEMVGWGPTILYARHAEIMRKIIVTLALLCISAHANAGRPYWATGKSEAHACWAAEKTANGKTGARYCYAAALPSRSRTSGLYHPLSVGEKN